MQLTTTSSSSLNGTITVPGDKSISHRAVMFASLAEGESHITGWLPAADCQATVRAMRSLGVSIDVQNETETTAELIIQGVGREGLKAPSGPIDCHGSGTTMRLLCGILAGQPFEAVVDGHAGLRRRPMERIAKPLRLFGAEIQTTEGRPPLHIKGGRLTAINYELPMASAQVKSAALLAGLFAEGQTSVIEPGSTRDHTERLLRTQGVNISAEGNTIRLDPEQHRLEPLNMHVPADFSSAAFPLVAALLVPESEVTLTQVNANLTRTGLLDVLQAMQGDITISHEIEMSGEPLFNLRVRSSALIATEIQGDTVVRLIDEFPILAVAATQAAGVTIVRDAGELRVKETDRIDAVAQELNKMGAKIVPQPEGFEVHGPTPLTGVQVDSHGDHRLAMALAVAGLIAEGETTILDADVIVDSYPGFVTNFTTLGAKVKEG